MGKQKLPQDNTDRTNNANQKDADNKNMIALTQLNLLLELITLAAIREYRRIKELDDQQIKKSDVVEFEKNINHGLTLLKAAQVALQKDGRTAQTDYLLVSGLTKVAKYLPDVLINNIVEKLKSADEHAPQHFTLPSTTSTEQDRVKSKFDALVSVLNPALLSLEQPPFVKAARTDQHIVIDFAADLPNYIRYGKAVANHLGANLLQIKPHQFSAQQAKFSIMPNMTLTLIGHCHKGSNCLSDNSGNVIYDIEIASEIYAKMLQNNTPLDTKFTIDLIACQAASADGNNPAFAERLLNALASYGINNVSIVASPTIMCTTSDGRQSNLSKEEEDRERSTGKKRSEITYLINDVTSSLSSLFNNKNDKLLKEEKITFKSTKPGK